MTASPPSPEPGSWKQAGAPRADFRGGPRPGSRESWRPSPESLSSRGYAWLVLRRVVLTLILVGLVSLLLWLLLSLNRAMPVVACIASSYEAPLQPIRLAHEDAALIERLSRSDGSIFRGRSITLSNMSGELATANADAIVEAIDQRLSAVKPGGPDKNVVMVYVSMLGGIDSTGRACLIPPGITVAESSLSDGRCLSVEKLLRSVRQTVPASSGVVVVLDACHGGLQWPLGLTDGCFPAAVEAALAAADLPRTWVLLPASSGQSSQASLVDGASVFGRFFTAGLRGAADVAGSGNRNGTVELGELVAYLGSEVDHWSITHHGARQTPQLLPAIARPGRGGDPKLARVTSWEAEREMAALLARYRGIGSPIDADAWLAERWRTAAALIRFGQRNRPLVLQQYLQLLVRAERLLYSGPGYALERRRTETLIERVEMELNANQVPNAEYLPALRMMWQDRPEGLAELSRKLTSWRDDLAARVTKPAAEPAAKQTAPSPPTTAIEWNRQANVAWSWLMERIDAGDPVDRELLGRWLESVGPAPVSVPAEPPQIQAARVLYADGPLASWQAAPLLPALLLRATDLSREARFSEDVRTDRILATLLPNRQADDDRRLAYDLFFLGGRDALARAETLVRGSLARSRAALEAGEAISGALHDSNRLLDELPWLSAWWVAEDIASRVASLSDKDGLSDRTVSAEFDWSAAVEVVGQFDAAIAALNEDALPPGEQAEQLLQRLQLQQNLADAAIQPVRDAFRTTVDELVTSAPDTPDTLARIRRLLATPLVFGDTRLSLLRRSDELSRRFADVVDSQAEELRHLRAPDVDTITAGWMLWRGLSMNPLVAILTEQAAGAAVRPEQPAELAAACGGQIAQVAATLAAAARGAAGPPIEQVVDADVADRVVMQREEVASRSLAALIGPRASSTLSPHVRLKFINWHDRLVTAAHDALDDFWAGIDPTNSPERSADGPPWCSTAAKVLVDKAAELIEYARLEHGASLRSAVLARLEEMSAGRTTEGQAFGTLRLQPRSIPVIRSNPGDLPMNSVTLAPRGGVPPGMAAVWFAESLSGSPLAIAHLDTGPLDAGPVDRLPLPVAAMRGETQVSWRIDGEAVAGLARSDAGRDDGRVLDMVAWFRGHRVVVAAPLAATTAVRVMEWQARPALPPRVTVRGAIPRNQTVAVVFDCSGSMGQRLPDGRSRMEAGRTALYEVLEEIATDGGWTTSVWLYGHRTRWSRDRRGRYTSDLTAAGKRDREQKTAAGDGTYALVPGNDVEQVMDLQPLVPLQVGRIRGMLDDLEPGGETPLYLAINEALRVDFAGLNPGPGHVLVVTDGANDQSGGRITSSADVLRTLSRLNFRRQPADRVRIDVIGFDLMPGVFDRELRLQDLQSLAADSGGKYYDATDPRRLSAALRSSLQISRWRAVEGATFSEQAVLGEAITLPKPVEGTSATYDIVLEGGSVQPRRRVSVTGGEGLELFVAGGGRNLEFRRYDGGTEQGIRDAVGPIPDRAAPERTFFVAAHLARRDGETVTFPISVQNGVADGFSPKPVEMWTVLQPLGPDGPVGLPYAFFDLLFQPDRPVPVLDLVASDWPDRATSAQIKAWFRFEPAEADVSIPVNDFLQAIERTVRLPNMPGSSLRVLVKPPDSPTSLRLDVIEEHPATVAPALPVLRVAVGPNCMRAVHILAPGGSRVRHEFTVAMLDGQLPPDVRLTATRAEVIQLNAVGPLTPGGDPKTLQVPVPGR